MKSFKQMFSRTAPRIKRVVLAGNWGRANKNMRDIVNYFEDDFKSNLEEYENAIKDLDNVNFRDVVPQAYRNWVTVSELRNLMQFIIEISNRPADFRDKVSNYRVMVCFYTFYLLFLVKLVETYAGAAAAFKAADPYYNLSDLRLADLGINRRILSFYGQVEDLRTLSIDDWLKMDIDPSEETYLIIAFRRIFFIFGF